MKTISSGIPRCRLYFLQGMCRRPLLLNEDDKEVIKDSGWRKGEKLHTHKRLKYEYIDCILSQKNTYFHLQLQKIFIPNLITTTSILVYIDVTFCIIFEYWMS